MVPQRSSCASFFLLCDTYDPEKGEKFDRDVFLPVALRLRIESPLFAGNLYMDYRCIRVFFAFLWIEFAKDSRTAVRLLQASLAVFSRVDE